jgi:hypothetical protein
MRERAGSLTFSFGLFALDLDFWDPNRTASWAEYELDLMGQPVVRFHCLAADGFGADSYSWYPSLFLRVDYVRQCLDLVVEVDGDWSIEATFPLEELHETLIDAELNEAEPEKVFMLLLGAARPVWPPPLSAVPTSPVSTRWRSWAQASKRRWYGGAAGSARRVDQGRPHSEGLATEFVPG